MAAWTVVRAEADALTLQRRCCADTAPCDAPAVVGAFLKRPAGRGASLASEIEALPVFAICHAAASPGAGLAGPACGQLLERLCRHARAVHGDLLVHGVQARQGQLTAFLACLAAHVAVSSGLSTPLPAAHLGHLAQLWATLGRDEDSGGALRELAAQALVLGAEAVQSAHAVLLRDVCALSEDMCWRTPTAVAHLLKPLHDGRAASMTQLLQALTRALSGDAGHALACTLQGVLQSALRAVEGAKASRDAAARTTLSLLSLAASAPSAAAIVSLAPPALLLAAAGAQAPALRRAAATCAAALLAALAAPGAAPCQAWALQLLAAAAADKDATVRAKSCALVLTHAHVIEHAELLWSAFEALHACLLDGSKLVRGRAFAAMHALLSHMARAGVPDAAWRRVTAALAAPLGAALFSGHAAAAELAAPATALLALIAPRDDAAVHALLARAAEAQESGLLAACMPADPHAACALWRRLLAAAPCTAAAVPPAVRDSLARAALVAVHRAVRGSEFAEAADSAALLAQLGPPCTHVAAFWDATVLLAAFNAAADAAAPLLLHVCTALALAARANPAASRAISRHLLARLPALQALPPACVVRCCEALAWQARTSDAHSVALLRGVRATGPGLRVSLLLLAAGACTHEHQRAAAAAEVDSALDRAGEAPGEERTELRAAHVAVAMAELALASVPGCLMPAAAAVAAQRGLPGDVRAAALHALAAVLPHVPGGDASTLVHMLRGALLRVGSRGGCTRGLTAPQGPRRCRRTSAAS